MPYSLEAIISETGASVKAGPCPSVIFRFGCGYVDVREWRVLLVGADLAAWQELLNGGADHCCKQALAGNIGDLNFHGYTPMQFQHYGEYYLFQLRLLPGASAEQCLQL